MGRVIRGCCPGCGRDDVILLPPRDPTPSRPGRPWRRKDHAIAGHGQYGPRCRYIPKELTDAEAAAVIDRLRSHDLDTPPLDLP